MKAVYLILGAPVFAFLTLAFTLDLGSLIAVYPDSNITAYLCSRSLSKDLDLAYTSNDSDRYFKEVLRRPSRFEVVQKTFRASSNESSRYTVLYYPDVYVFFLAPFTGLFGFQGILVLHALLIGVLYGIGYFYYRIKTEPSFLPALNSLIYFTLVPVPILFLIPSHALFLLVVISAAIFAGIRGKTILSALLLALAFSTQPWALLFALFLVGYWQHIGQKKDVARFAVVLLLAVLCAWGIEQIMYPRGSISEVRWVPDVLTRPIADVWDTLPAVQSRYFAKPSVQRVIDFLLGRSIGFFVYGFAAAGLMGSCLWLAKDRLVQRSLLFFILFLLVVSISDPSSWGANAFISDLWILLCAIPFFMSPILRPAALFFSIAMFTCFLIGPLLVNPLGAIINRVYYLQSFPYKYFPIELSLIGKFGITAIPVFQFPYDGGKVYFLNDQFYPEKDYFWVHGGSNLEILLQATQKKSDYSIRIQNGPLDNRVLLKLGNRVEELHLAPSEAMVMDLNRFSSGMREFEGQYYLHGKIESRSGFVPMLFSRENADYRYLGCQVQIIKDQHNP